jgi:hypothetical protein
VFSGFSRGRAHWFEDKPEEAENPAKKAAA